MYLYRSIFADNYLKKVICYLYRLNDNTISNQISFRLGFYKNNFDKRNQGYVLIDSQYNITFYPQDYNFDEQVELSKNRYKIFMEWNYVIYYF